MQTTSPRRSLLMLEPLHLGPSHLDNVLRLESVVLSGLERFDLLRRNSREMWQQCLQPPHTALGMMSESEQLVALAVLYIPEPDGDENLSKYLKSIQEKGLRCGNYKICLVHPDWRGQGLQQRLGQHIETIAQQQGIRMLCSTVSPHNPASRCSMEHLGYQSDGTIEKYGFERMLYYKMLTKEP